MTCGKPYKHCGDACIFYVLWYYYTRGGKVKELYYCTKCGNTKTGEKQCLICQGQDIAIVPKKYVSYIADVVPVLNEDLQEEFVEKVVKMSPNFDSYWYEHKDEITQNMKQQYEKVKSFQKEQLNVPKCPTCQSTNIKKIGTGERVASVAMMGIFSKKINKSFKCKNCGYTW